MGVRYTLVDTSTNAPSNAAITYNAGFNIPGGAVDEIIIRCTETLNAAGDIAADWPNVVSSLRLILNGETVWDFQAGYQDAANNGPSPLGYLLNSMGRGGDPLKARILKTPTATPGPPAKLFTKAMLSTKAQYRLLYESNLCVHHG